MYHILGLETKPSDSRPVEGSEKTAPGAPPRSGTGGSDARRLAGSFEAFRSPKPLPRLFLHQYPNVGCSRIILYYIILYYTILYYTILYYTILYYTILYYTILYYTILYYTILYYTILYFTILYYTILAFRPCRSKLGSKKQSCKSPSRPENPSGAAEGSEDGLESRPSALGLHVSYGQHFG